jgi:hypothetical protein
VGEELLTPVIGGLFFLTDCNTAQYNTIIIIIIIIIIARIVIIVVGVTRSRTRRK